MAQSSPHQYWQRKVSKEMKPAPVCCSSSVPRGSKSQLQKGVSELLPSLVPSLECLLKKSSTATDDDKQRDAANAIHVTAQQIMEARCEEEAVVTKLLEV
jgi:hypothetical protein